MFHSCNETPLEVPIVLIIRFLPAALGYDLVLPEHGMLLPLSWSKTCFFFEYFIEMGVRREAALKRDGIVAVLGKLYHHALHLFKANVAQPASEAGLQVLIKETGQYPFFYLKLHGKHGHIGLAVPESPGLAPLVQRCLDLCDARFSQPVLAFVLAICSCRVCAIRNRFVSNGNRLYVWIG